jgi:hypothetical protein
MGGTGEVGRWRQRLLPDGSAAVLGDSGGWLSIEPYLGATACGWPR